MDEDELHSLSLDDMSDSKCLSEIPQKTLIYTADNIKSEITFEDEQITETTFLELPTEQVCQVEIETSLDYAEENTNNTIGEMCELQDEDEHIELNDSQLSDALNDHNYTSQEIVSSPPRLDSVKDLLLSQIVSNRSHSETVPTNVTNFVDNTIIKMKILRMENVEKKPDECASQTNNINLPSNCSEPLEVEANDEYFESLYKNLNENDIVLNSLLTDTMNCAKEIFNECNVSTLKTEEEFRAFITEKVKKLTKIANITGSMRDQSVQTFSKGFLRKRHRMNHNAKRDLLDSSDSSNIDSDNTDSENENKCILIEPSPKVDRLRVVDNDTEPSRRVEYDDGIDLSKYIKIDITNRKLRQMSCDIKSEEDNSCTSADDTDKEIERLTNLNGLKKRNLQSRHGKPKDKNKPKPLSVKNTNNLEEDDDDMEVYDTENSFKESDDEIITENQYLSRFNEQIKMQLLNDSNSDSGLSDQSDYNMSKECSSTENETKTDVVDKFLQVFKCESDEVLKDYSNNETKDKSEIEIISKESDSLDVSDEIWNDSFIQQKRSKKSLEKLLAEAEKRNQNEEIVLSSESDYSDAEPEPVEEKTRIIKPMLRMDQLANETRAAQKSETERIRRLDKKHTILAKAVKNAGQSNKSSLILDYLEKTKTFVKVDDEIVNKLKPHQVDGVKFMYDSCYGGIDHTKKNTGSGCILAHCMGLGKTLQLIALLHTVISYKELNTTKVLVLCPKSTVMNWADELQRWLGPLKSKTNIKVFVFPDSSDISDKLRVLEEWSLSSTNRAGCLLVGYEAFRTLVFYHSYKNRGNLSSSKLENIRDSVNKYLLEPGADLVVCDEGHIIKNSKSAISLAVAKIITPKRIILTGTPIQNNLKEYYSMVNFIKPLYLGTEKEFANLYANPIKNGQHKDSGKKDITVMKQRSYVLHKKLSKFVQRKEAELLKTFLPQKFEYVLFIPMTAVQNTLYEYILEAIASRGDSRGKSLITDYTVLRKIWTHPKVLEDAWKNANQKNKKDSKKSGLQHSDDDQPDDIYDSQTGLISVTNDWWRKYLTKKDLETIMPSNKLRTMFSILRMCEEKGEKCLIFSAFVAVLNVVEYFFKKITESDPEILQHTHIHTNFKASNTWINGQDYYRLDGKTPKNIRHEMIKRFNSEANRRARVFLISAKAGGQGINLIGANRVIILDTSWNPSNDQQNIFRIFRLGQKKNCYIYRLIAMGTMEEKVYSRSVTKQAMSFRVVDEQQIDRHYNMAELAELYTLTKPVQSERTMPVLPKDTILAHLLRQSELVYKYHEHDSLLENKVEQELSEQEKADAWDTYERELQMNLAQQEGLTADKNPNSMPASKLNPYLGAVPGLDMQTLLNYSLQSASLIPQYGYGLNQSYLDTLNMYQKFSSLRYPDMNAEINNFTASPFGVMNSTNANRIQSNASLMSNMQSLANAKQHSREFGLFDAQKSRTGQSLAHPPLHHGLASESPTLASLSANANVNNVLSGLGQYKQMMDNPLSNLLNYSAQGYSSLGQGGGILPNLNVPNEIYTDKVLEAVENLNKKDKAGKSRSSIDQNIVQKAMNPQEIRSANVPVVSSVDLTSSTPLNVPVAASTFAKNATSVMKHPGQPTTSVDLTTTTTPLSSKKALTLPNILRQTSMTNLQNDDDKSVKTANSGNASFSLGYSRDGAPTLSKDFLKNNAAMQIIPTTSPPGTSSITKQLNEMSPSISLTAVNPPTENSKARTQDLQKSTNSPTTFNKSKKSVNSNIFSLSKSSSSSLPNLPTSKTISVREKAMPVIFPLAKKTPAEISSIIGSEIGKVSVTPVKAVNSSKSTNSSSSISVKPLSGTQLVTKLNPNVSKLSQQFRPTINTQISNDTGASNSSKDISFQGENRKRSAESPKANLKRSKLANDSIQFN
ncbi:transcriptional regulator ATRX homolog [Drosophila innubila]|uniref:transcriptional regulator ATRX homolog n=1 Tax=Drosophila innubila TaxID=198719 RepID=UPI00148B6423|nr:transcriptional regulator ATRX homolog [Drosophila innubila]